MKDKVTTPSEYDNLTTSEKSSYVRSYYDSIDGSKLYATSPDFNLRELEISYILKNIKGVNILDLGCGNGYTLMRVAEKIKGNLVGVDFSTSMINGANELLEKYPNKLSSHPKFFCSDAVKFVPETGFNSIDTVISERFLLNLPSEDMQYEAIHHVHKLLTHKGVFIMIEGSKDGLENLNKLRKSFDLDEIIDRDKHNLSSNKFEDQKIGKILDGLFKIQSIKSFDLYYIISRIVYPSFINPNSPKYDHFINETARTLEQLVDFPSKGIGHVKCYILEKV